MDSPFHLSSSQLEKLTQLHKTQERKKFADRIKTIILLHKGLTPAQVTDILLLSERHVRRLKETFLEKGIEALLKTNYLGSHSELSDEQLDELDDHLQKTLYPTAKEICIFVKKRFRVRYTPNGIVALLHRLGYVYKQAKGIPGRCDRESQKKFLRKYRGIRRNLGKNDKIFFLDAAHPTFNTMLACGWIKKGEEKSVATNSGRHRINLHGSQAP